MPRVKRYIDADVYVEAKDRIRHILDIHDSSVVCFSGGKDSLATLHLVREVHEERGLGPVDVIFRDEEFIPSVVIDFVQGHREKDWLNLHYFCVPLRSTRFVLGVSTEYIQWDPARDHIRQKPDFAIECRPGEESLVLDQFTSDRYIAERLQLPGKVAFINGIRASESLIRLRASVEKLNDNYINKSSSYKVSMCKPIFDWQENDVFRYFYDNDIEYCQVYDSQLWARQALRVATPMVSESAKSFGKFKDVDPTLYQQCVDVFPEMLLQSRYWKEYQRFSKRQVKENSESLSTIRQWIAENIVDPPCLKIALDSYKNLMGRRRNDPGGYPLDYIYKYFQTGAYKKKLLPLPKSQRKNV